MRNVEDYSVVSRTGTWVVSILTCLYIFSCYITIYII